MKEEELQRIPTPLLVNMKVNLPIAIIVSSTQLQTERSYKYATTRHKTFRIFQTIRATDKQRKSVIMHWKSLKTH